MYKGNYILLSKEELKNKIFDYLNTSFELNNDSILEICIEKNNINTPINNLLQKIVGENKNSIEDINTTNNFISINARECSYMLSKIFELNKLAIFDEETLSVNNFEDIYLFYKE